MNEDSFLPTRCRIFEDFLLLFQSKLLNVLLLKHIIVHLKLELISMS